VNEDTEKLLLLIGLCLVVGLVLTFLASIWYRVTYKEQLDRDTVFLFAKIFFGIGGVAVLTYLFVKYL
jgi:hypothetical protein